MHPIDEKLVKKVLEVIEPGLVAGLGERIPGKMCVEAAVCFALDLPHGDDPPCVSRAVRALKLRLNDADWSNDLTRAEGMKRIAIAQLGTNENFDDKLFAKRCTELVISKYIPLALRAVAKVDVEYADKLEAAAVRCENEKSGEAATAAVDAAVAAGYTDAATPAIHAAAYAARAAARAATRAAARSADAAARAAGHAARVAAAYAARAARTTAAARSTARAAAAADTTATYNAIRDDNLADFAEDIVQILIEMGAEGTKWLHLTE